ncbi:hypothetical protein GCM10008090_17050 [Arenicella chitinivorans]|uniref:DNA repair protein n=1 Tax=Arenicella chitinivorans TaxID=1329800 RepID=A0A918RPD1_9GAMM|nr:DNA repair ATPase [Arenicella chitinivorans]GHA07811.1 hypothetical protein GCM10008090_17050 [Arenicella chitinivorans]
MPQTDTQVVDNAVAQAGAYDIIRKRLTEQGHTLSTLTQTLNNERLSEFGGVQFNAIGRTRIRTENNCIARDIVQVGDQLLFGYNVFIGLKKDTRVNDVFALFTFDRQADQLELVESDITQSFLFEARFKSDFEELYRYYKEARLVQLINKNGKLLAGFQVGERENDLRVFRWSISPDGKQLDYIDNRGERDIQLPNQYDFEWIETNRDHFVHGKHPHVNIADTVFVETIGGDLTIKIENNTEDGLGIYSEPVDEPNQSLDDGQINYALVGHLVLLAITPYKETTTRYLVYNTLTENVDRIDAIGDSCIQLPEDHGIIFPGGYYLETGDTKSFPGDIDGLRFKRVIRSPNGEDVLFVFYEDVAGKVALFSYNLITKSLQNPIFSNGYALYDDGTLIVFSAEQEPTRVHPMQVWQTSYISDEYASQQPESTSELGRIGNSELVRGISDLYSINQLIQSDEVSMRHYEELNAVSKKIFDQHYWLDDTRHSDIAKNLRQIAETAELVIDEFEKVQSIQKQSSQALKEAKAQQRSLLTRIATTTWETASQFISAIADIRKQRGHIATIREYRYINQDDLAQMDAELVEAEQTLGASTVDFLGRESALTTYTERTTEFAAAIENAETNADIRPVLTDIDDTTAQLDLLSELVTTLKIDDTTLRTRIVDGISEVYANLNQTKAKGSQKQKGLGSEEATAQFSAQFKLFSQSITNALGIADTPERCDEQLAKLLVQLEDLESQFSGFEQFLADILEKREALYDAFEAHKQSLMEARQRRAQTLADSAARILTSIEKRSLRLTEIDELNTYFASDALVLKSTEIVGQLRELDADVAADDIASRFKGLKEQAIRTLRDKTDIFEDGGKVIKLGPKHRFSVNQQELDLTIIPKEDRLTFHLIGTDYYEPVADERLHQSQQFWAMSQESETNTVYRAEYLSYLILETAQSGNGELSMQQLLVDAQDLGALTKIARDFSTPLYKHGYQKGIHDHDAARILHAILPAIDAAGTLIYEPEARGIAQLFWASVAQIHPDDGETKRQNWQQRAQSAARLHHLFNDNSALAQLSAELAGEIDSFLASHPIKLTQTSTNRVSAYLVDELALGNKGFAQSQHAKSLIDDCQHVLDSDSRHALEESLQTLATEPAQQWALAKHWLEAVARNQGDKTTLRFVPEAAANLVAKLELRPCSEKLQLQVDDLLGDHTRIDGQSLKFSIDEYMQRLAHHHQHVVPEYLAYLESRSALMKRERARLKLNSFKAKPLSSFVRNRLVNESYLPIIGDNLAKQMGAVGDSKRTDLMGLLMMISPPGYGKTTLMEYVANRLGLIFMKINCPALGHDVTSLDPEQAPNSTARQELEKINLAFEMGNNVMLYLDDIQHTHPEFLQKYISLCDGTRRIEGVWRGETKTYDMRGKKFCVVMAGNPYTESGEVFKVPDMLANRADIYNLGDILGGMEAQFALSYIENALTSNPVLAPLATRDMNDLYKLVGIAQGQNIATTELSHQYSAAEINEITNVLQKLFVIQELILKVNQQYIKSAAQADRYRTEPPFKLQGSYRNMNKMAEKVSAVMNDAEILQLMEDHYQGEAQLLTNGTEENLLKLAELRGNMTEDQARRWEQIKEDFRRTKSLGGDDADAGTRIANQVMDLVKGVGLLKTSLETSSQSHLEAQAAQQTTLISSLSKQQGKETKERLSALIHSMDQIGKSLREQPSPVVEVVNTPSPKIVSTLDALASAMENSIQPLILSMEKKMDIDLRTLERIQELTSKIEVARKHASETTRRRESGKKNEG